MTIQTIPTDQLAVYTQTTTLEGTTFVLTFQFNQRAASWYLSIADASGVDIYNGVKVIVGLPLLRRCKDPRRPAGDFVCLSSTADTSPPGLIELLPGSGRCTLYYVTSDVIAQLAAGNVATFTAQLDANAGAAPLSTYGQQ